MEALLLIDFDINHITPGVILGGILIALARVLDKSIGVVRNAAVRRRARKPAFVLSFLEATVWVLVVAAVIRGLDHWILLVFYSSGFATGTIVGILIENRMAAGEQVVRVFSYRGEEIAEEFRRRGLRVTQFEGTGASGPIQLLFIHVMRKKSAVLPALARQVDPECFVVVDDVQSSSMI